jgi:hypothetical protein
VLKARDVPALSLVEIEISVSDVDCVEDPIQGPGTAAFLLFLARRCGPSSGASCYRYRRFAQSGYCALQVGGSYRRKR